MATRKRPESRDESIRRVFHNLRRIVQVLYSHSRRLERTAELTLPQSWMITGLARSGTATVSELARIMHIRPATAIRILERLESRGLVVGSSSAGGRGPVKIALTHRGIKLAEKMPVVPQNVLQRGLRKIPEDRLESIVEGLESLANLLSPQRKVPLLFFSPIPEEPTKRPAR